MEGLLKERDENGPFISFSGFPVSTHPLAFHRGEIEALGCVPAAELHLWTGRTVDTAGVMITGKTVSTSQGRRMKFVSFEDETAIYEAVFFPDRYGRYGHMLYESRPCTLRGTVERSFGAISLTVHSMSFLDRRPANSV